MNQKGKGVFCVYVVVGQKQTSLLKILKTFKSNNCLNFSTIVMASAAEAAAMQYLAPFSGASIGEYFMSKGRDVLIVYDDLSKHAVAYRQMSLLLRRPPGREGYPGDVWATVRLYLCMLNLKFINKKNKIKKNLSIKINKCKSFSFRKRNVRMYSTVIKIKKKVEQIKIGFVTLKKALDVYDNLNYLKIIDIISIVLLFAGFFSWSLSLLEINIFFSSFYLACLSIFEYILGFLLSIYTCIKRLYFIYNYDLKCNPHLFVKLMMGEIIVGRTALKGVTYFCGGTVSANYVVSEITGVSVFREFGKHYVYGDEDFKGTADKIYEKFTTDDPDRFKD